MNDIGTPCILIGALCVCVAANEWQTRAGEMTDEEVTKIKAIIQNPRQYNVPDWFLNRRKDMKTGNNLHIHAHQIAATWREDLQKWKKTKYVHYLIIDIA